MARGRKKRKEVAKNKSKRSMMEDKEEMMSKRKTKSKRSMC